jgi:hypothetical protein
LRDNDGAGDLGAASVHLAIALRSGGLGGGPVHVRQEQAGTHRGDRDEEPKSEREKREPGAGNSRRRGRGASLALTRGAAQDAEPHLFYASTIEPPPAARRALCSLIFEHRNAQHITGRRRSVSVACARPVRPTPWLQPASIGVGAACATFSTGVVSLRRVLKGALQRRVEVGPVPLDVVIRVPLRQSTARFGRHQSLQDPWREEPNPWRSPAVMKPDSGVELRNMRSPEQCLQTPALSGPRGSAITQWWR